MQSMSPSQADNNENLRLVSHAKVPAPRASPKSLTGNLVIIHSRCFKLNKAPSNVLQIGGQSSMIVLCLHRFLS